IRPQDRDQSSCAISRSCTTWDQDASGQAFTSRNALSPKLAHLAGEGLSLVRVVLERFRGVCDTLPDSTGCVKGKNGGDARAGEAGPDGTSTIPSASASPVSGRFLSRPETGRPREPDGRRGATQEVGARFPRSE